MAVDAGARQIQGTLNGLGERCGNANLVSVIPTLKLKSGYETGIRDEDLMHLTRISHMLDEILNNPPDHHAPYVGSAAFAHKGGLHVSAVMKDPRTYEHVPPASVGNRRHIVVSGQSGKSNVLARLAEAGIEVDQGHPRLGRLVEEIKAREFEGYSYDGAEASFELLARRVLGTVATYFEVESFRVLVERRHNALGSLVTSSEATVKLVVDGERLLSVAEGNGPVDALNHALVKDLGKYAGLSGRLAAGRLQGEDSLAEGRDRCGDKGRHREHGRKRRFLEHRRGFGQHHRCIVPGAGRFHHLQAAARERAGLMRPPAIILVRPQLGENIGAAARAHGQFRAWGSAHRGTAPTAGRTRPPGRWPREAGRSSSGRAFMPLQPRPWATSIISGRPPQGSVTCSNQSSRPGTWPLHAGRGR